MRREPACRQLHGHETPAAKKDPAYRSCRCNCCTELVRRSCNVSARGQNCFRETLLFPFPLWNSFFASPEFYSRVPLLQHAVRSSAIDFPVPCVSPPFSRCRLLCVYVLLLGSLNSLAAGLGGSLRQRGCDQRDRDFNFPRPEPFFRFWSFCVLNLAVAGAALSVCVTP